MASKFGNRQRSRINIQNNCFLTKISITYLGHVIENFQLFVLLIIIIFWGLICINTMYTLKFMNLAYRPNYLATGKIVIYFGYSKELIDFICRMKNLRLNKISIFVKETRSKISSLPFANVIFRNRELYWRFQL